MTPRPTKASQVDRSDLLVPCPMNRLGGVGYCTAGPGRRRRFSGHDLWMFDRLFTERDTFEWACSTDSRSAG